MSGSSAGQRVPEEPGSATEEAARLAEALHGWWTRDASPQLAEPGHTAEPGHRASDTCRHCPLCRGMAAAHAARPEVVGHLLTAVEALAAAWQELSRDRSAESAQTGSAQTESAQTESAQSGNVPAGRPDGSADPLSG
jgi:hypothetical protein